DVIGGRVELMFDPVASVGPHVKSGRLRAIGITTRTRSHEFPDVPPIADTLPGYESTSWVVFLGPAKLPQPIVERLHAETVRALNLPDVKERFIKMGAEPLGNSPAEARRFVLAEQEKWAKTIKAAGIKGEQ